ncbi:hypothetical protein [Streptomyces asiaticus]|uniref:hypothetical protein n=1 Tax=Streptomyces asiaticus TaxID=114695 RepID=UPI003F67C143
MPDLLVQIDDKTLPLTNCVWITWAPCGCPCGALTAAYEDDAHATEQQAWQEIYPLKRDRDKYQRQGLVVDLDEQAVTEIRRLQQQHIGDSITIARLRRKLHNAQPRISKVPATAERPMAPDSVLPLTDQTVKEAA